MNTGGRNEGKRSKKSPAISTHCDKNMTSGNDIMSGRRRDCGTGNSGLEGGMVMVRPKAARVVGTVERSRLVYIEDYVLQYLTVCEEEEEEKEETVLYGRKEKDGGAEVYMIYGIYRQMGQDGSEGEDSGEKFDGKYRRLGYLHRETGAIVMDDWGAGENLKGYYVFYDAEEKMKDCLGEYYERQQLKRKKPYKGSSDAGEKMRSQNSLAELVALSNTDKGRERQPFLWIRMIVIGIFIVFCAIAVMTVNSFDKLHDFIQTAVLTGEIMDADESD